MKNSTEKAFLNCIIKNNKLLEKQEEVQAEEQTEDQATVRKVAEVKKVSIDNVVAVSTNKKYYLPSGPGAITINVTEDGKANNKEITNSKYYEAED